MCFESIMGEGGDDERKLLVELGLRGNEISQ